MEQILNNILDYFKSIDFLSLGEYILRLALAALFGGIIGNEREHTNRPAGLRTHMLVCVGSTLVMLTSISLLSHYNGTVSFDPTRMGAQVISGIGFLGAGTIIKEGFSVQGLTTAASLWTVSCIGLAIGAGFYSGAITATIIIYIVLEVMKRMLLRKVVNRMIALEVESLDQVIEAASAELHKLKIKILSTEIGVIDAKDGHPATLEVRIFVMMPKQKEIFEYALTRLRMIDGVKAQHVS
ncbi:MAG: MgtC/SapB family protein [Clostridia bacterium]|nr:MgtC/SapB family protein [Clostridia bacterium]